MKIIDLLNKIANGEEVPKKIKQKYLEGNSFEDLIDNLNYFNKDFSKTLNEEIEIIEKEAEIDIQGIKELEYVEDYEADETDIRLNRDKINELIQAVRQLDKNMRNRGALYE